MKTLGRTLIILAVFVLLSGLMITAVNAVGLNAPDFEGDRGPRPEFRPDNDDDSERPDDDREEQSNDRGFFLNFLYGGARWGLSTSKNIFVIGILVALVVFPKNWLRKKKKTSAVSS